MKPVKIAFWRMALALLFCAAGAVQGQGISFAFTLDEPCKTSAGVYKPDGTLVRTLWSKVRYYAPGTYSAVWDGLDDNSNMAPTGNYEIRLLQHNTEYVWDGAIGNTSAEMSGPTVHGGYWPMADMAISGTNAFYVSAYNEGKYDFRNFLTTDPQHVRMAWYWVYSSEYDEVLSVSGDVYDLNWLWAAADSNRVYFACSGTANPTNYYLNAYPGCIVACNVGDNSPAYFSQGMPIFNDGNNSPLPNGIYVGTQVGLSGLAVQPNGNLLAASVAPDNQVYLMDKTSGATITNFYVDDPGRLNFSPDGSLWVISSNSVICYTNVNSNAIALLTLSNFSEPLAVAVNPADPSLVLVADGGTNQQIMAFDNTGRPLWTYGQAGGYQANGSAVATNKFWFTDGENDETFLTFAPDGSFWVGDGGNNRSLHFSSARNYIEQIMYEPHSYITSVDRNNPSRVSNQFLEFSVDYTKPLAQGWTLVNNWQANVPPVNISWNKGIYEVTTFSNNHTYALIDNNYYWPYVNSELCELVTNQNLRLTGILPEWSDLKTWISFGSDGSARRTPIGEGEWYETTLGGFDQNNNPVWNTETAIASASNGPADPVPRAYGFGNIRVTISTNSILISFDPSLNNGWHLGGLRVGSTNWLWKASPSVGFMNGCGTFEISNGVQYAGNTMEALDRNVIYGYHGEFFRGQGQAGQNMHFYDDGLFVGQFGEASPGHSAYEGALPGFAGNGQCPNLAKTTNGDYYLWVNDESDHGPQRWHFVNARNIREQSGSGTLGEAITLTNPACGFPTAVAGKNGGQSGELSWLPVPGATSYNIFYSQMNGGPYGIFAGSTTNLNYVVRGLTDGQTYYFVVTAVQAGAEGIPSEQVSIFPFDTTQAVLCTGSMTEGGLETPVVDISSTALSSGLPSYIGAEHLTGVLNLRELDYYGYGNLQNETVGTQGYVIYDWQGPGTNLTNMASTFTITPGSGWGHVSNTTRRYKVDSTLGLTDGWIANPVASIDIGVSDTNFHYLTVISPAEFNWNRDFAMRLTSTNGASAAFNVNENHGLSHVFQFLFRGDVTLWADASGAGGTGAIVQALFLDNASVFAPLQSSNGSPTTLPALTGATMLGNGAFQFSFSNSQNLPITVLSTTNLTLPLNSWTAIGVPSNIAPGLFQFTTQSTANDSPRFYTIRSP
ncbi:MAG: fibronectin type III domain-containing protein [Limisphaerales bacterium]